MRSIKQAVLVGSNWGLIYLEPLRQTGVELQALLGTDLAKNQAVAEQHGIPFATTNPAELNDPELVVVACPAKHHRQVIEQFPNSAIICEKPLQGIDDYPSALPAWADNLWVNYAFSHLHSAKQAAIALRTWPKVEQVHLKSSANLALDFNIEQWFLETASHPLSWLFHLFGKPSVKHKTTSDHQLILELDCNGTRIKVDFEHGGEEGIFHHLQFSGAEQALSFSGCYRPGQRWRFEPIVMNGEAINKGEYSDSDCWMDANRRSIQLIVKVLRQQISVEQGLSLGLFNAEKALYLEQVICGE